MRDDNKLNIWSNCKFYHKLIFISQEILSLMKNI